MNPVKKQKRMSCSKLLFESTFPLKKLRAETRRRCSTAVDASLVAAVVVPGVLYSVLRYSAMSEMSSG